MMPPEQSELSIGALYVTYRFSLFINHDRAYALFCGCPVEVTYAGIIEQ